jgi:hypothetical protein
MSEQNNRHVVEQAFAALKALSCAGRPVPRCYFIVATHDASLPGPFRSR